MSKPLKVLFIINALFNGVGAILLLFATGILNSLTGISSEADFIWHLLGTCSLALAVLSLCAIKVRERYAIQIIILTFLLFNFLTGVVSIITLLSGASQFVIVNTLMHGVLFIVFLIAEISVLRKHGVQSRG